MLATNGGAPADIDVYEDTCGFVTYVINPIRGASGNESRNIGWMTFSITYTFSGLKRPGANLKNPQSKFSCTLHELDGDHAVETRKNERMEIPPDLLNNVWRDSIQAAL